MDLLYGELFLWSVVSRQSGGTGQHIVLSVRDYSIKVEVLKKSTKTNLTECKWFISMVLYKTIVSMLAVLLGKITL